MAIITTKWAWRELAPVFVPPGRVGHTLVMANDRIIMFGGVTEGVGFQDLIHEFYDDNWHEVTPFGDWPAARGYHTACWTGSEMIVTGGLGGVFGDVYFPDTWSYVPGSGFTEITTANYPDDDPTHFFHQSANRTMVWDTVNDRALLIVPYLSPDEMQTWGFDLSDWAQLSPSTEWGAEVGSVHTFPREHIASTWAGDRMITIGGQVLIGVQLGATNDVHELPVSPFGWELTSPEITFNTFPTAAGVIENVGANSAAWTGDMVFYYGGSYIHSSSTPTAVTARQFLYTPGIPTIAELTLPGTPSARCFHKFVFDGRRILMFGGQSGFSSGTPNAETWVLEPPLVASIKSSFGLGT